MHGIQQITHHHAASSAALEDQCRIPSVLDQGTMWHAFPSQPHSLFRTIYVTKKNLHSIKWAAKADWQCLSRLTIVWTSGAWSVTIDISSTHSGRISQSPWESSQHGTRPAMQSCMRNFHSRDIIVLLTAKKHTQTSVYGANSR